MGLPGLVRLVAWKVCSLTRVLTGRAADVNAVARPGCVGARASGYRERHAESHEGRVPLCRVVVAHVDPVVAVRADVVLDLAHGVGAVAGGVGLAAKHEDSAVGVGTHVVCFEGRGDLVHYTAPSRIDG